MHARYPLEDLEDALGRHRAPWVAVIDDVLSAEECHRFIAHMEALSPSQATINRGSYQEVNSRIRNNDRVIFDDEAFAAELWSRLGPLVPEGLTERRARMLTDRRMVAVGMNERFRGYRYSPGQRFAPHFDGAFMRSEEEMSLLTVILYLNEGCAGGETALLDFDIKIQPRRGSALLFEHAIYHEGCVVTAGIKYALRTDVMYRNAEDPK
jgi:prolyl 4-hydroxylase